MGPRARPAAGQPPHRRPCRRCAATTARRRRRRGRSPRPGRRGPPASPGRPRPGRPKRSTVNARMLMSSRERHRSRVGVPGEDGDRLPVGGGPLRALDELEVAALVEGIDLLGLGRGLPGGGQLGHLLGVLGGQVVQLGRVGGEVVELPLRVVEGGQGRVAGDDLPTVPVVPAVADHLVDLLGPGRRVVGVAQGGRERRSRHRDAAAVPWRSDGASTPVRSSSVGSRSITWAYWRRSSPRASRWSGHEHDEGHRVAAGVGVDLVEPERRVGRHGPAPGVVGHGLGPAEQVDAGQVGLHVGLARAGGRSSRWCRRPRPPARPRCRR